MKFTYYRNVNYCLLYVKNSNYYIIYYMKSLFAINSQGGICALRRWQADMSLRIFNNDV